MRHLSNELEHDPFRSNSTVNFVDPFRVEEDPFVPKTASVKTEKPEKTADELKHFPTDDFGSTDLSNRCYAVANSFDATFDLAPNPNKATGITSSDGSSFEKISSPADGLFSATDAFECVPTFSMDSDYTVVETSAEVCSAQSDDTVISSKEPVQTSYEFLDNEAAELVIPDLVFTEATLVSEVSTVDMTSEGRTRLLDSSTDNSRVTSMTETDSSFTSNFTCDTSDGVKPEKKLLNESYDDVVAPPENDGDTQSQQPEDRQDDTELTRANFDQLRMSTVDENTSRALTSSPISEPTTVTAEDYEARWRQTFQETLTSKDKQETVDIAKLKETAKTEIETFYAQRKPQIETTRELHRALEQPTAKLSTKSVWEEMQKIIIQTTEKSEPKTKERYDSVMNILRKKIEVERRLAAVA